MVRLLSVLFLLCSLNLTTVAGIFHISERDEIKLGGQAASQVERSTPLVKNDQVHDYVNKMGNKLVEHSKRRHIKYHFKVVNVESINAFALPGGYIYIHRGLIEQAETENEFIGVLAHEVAHITEKHSVEQIARARKKQAGFALAGIAMSLAGFSGTSAILNGAELVSLGVFSKFSRQAEREADHEGARMMYRAGWNPNGMISFFQKLAKQGSRGVNFFSTHPSPQERYRNIHYLVASWDLSKTKVDSKEFQDIKKAVAKYPKPPKTKKKTTSSRRRYRR